MGNQVLDRDFEMIVRIRIVTVDIADTGRWYERLFGRPADNNPMESLPEWRVTESAWLQVSSGTEALMGQGQFCLAVNDLRQVITQLQSREIVLSDITPSATVLKSQR